MNAADCHLHVLDPARFPYTDRSHYLPAAHETATASDLLTLHDAHGITHALVVGPTSGYGRDNSCLLDALARGSGRWRGIAVVAPEATDTGLSALAAGGVVGVRLDLATHGPELAGTAQRAGLFDRMHAQDGWVLQVQADAHQIPPALPALRAAARKLPMVFDHCGRPDPTLGLGQPGFQALLELGREGLAFAKLSGAFRWASDAYPHPAAEPFVAAILDAFTPARLVWGSDWPFLRAPFRVDLGPQLALLARWLPDSADRRAVLWETPRHLFGFAGS